jgi:hypothetical protein
MASSKWSVRLALDASVTTELMNAMSAVVAQPGAVFVHQLEYDFGSREDEEPVTLTIELNATDAQEARIFSQELFGKAQSLAGGSERIATVVWVAPIAPGPESSHRFLSRAKEFISDKEFGLAVVAAQIHLEVQVTTLVRQAIEPDPSPLVKVLMDRHRGWPPQHEASQRVLEALFGVKVTAFPGWSDYKTHVKRRNDVVHAGASIDRSSAEASLQVVSSLWLWLNENAQRVNFDHEHSPRSR